MKHWFEADVCRFDLVRFYWHLQAPCRCLPYIISMKGFDADGVVVEDGDAIAVSEDEYRYKAVRLLVRECAQGEWKI